MTLRAEDVAFAYGDLQVLRGVSLSVPEGRLLGVVGPNGSGKSTLLRCLAGLLRPRSGRVLLGGADLAGLSRRAVARVLAFVPQACHPAFPVSVEHFVGLGRFAREQAFGGPAARDADVVARCLEEMGVASLAGRRIDALSGGEFRRVLVAQALAQEPSVLLLDEPVQQLDLLHQIEVMGFARDFSRRPGSSAVVVLHDLGLAARYCDAVALLHGGRVLVSGGPEEVFSPDRIRTAWGVEASVQRCPATGALQVVPLRPARPEPAGKESP